MIREAARYSTRRRVARRYSSPKECNQERGQGRSICLRDPATVRPTRAAVVLMHNRGTSSRDMYREAVYEDAARDVAHELGAAIDAAVAAGIARNAIIVDPGIGFAKRAAHSYEVLARLGELRPLDRPILSGPSRKSFLKEALGERVPHERECGTAAAVTASVLFGAHIVRVHDVAHMADVVRVADRIRQVSAGLPS